MAPGNGSQVLCGPYTSKELPSYQAAVQVLQTWQHFLSRNQIMLLQSVIDRTARFGKSYRYIARNWFHDGHDPKQETGYAGCAPMPPVSDKTFYALRAELIRLGLLRVSRGVYRVNYSITPLHLATDTTVQRRVLHENKRGGALSTIEGIMEWATYLLNRLVRFTQESKSKTSCATTTPKCGKNTGSAQTRKSQANFATRGKPTCTTPQQGLNSGSNSGDSLINKDSPYTFHIKNYGTSPSKLGDIWGEVKDYLMGNKTAADILSEVTSSVSTRRDRTREKRAKRRTLADRMTIFEQKWGEGQRAAEGGGIPTRIDQRGKKLIKDQLLRRAEGSELDTDDFAFWTARHWHAIGAQYFAKAKSYPEKPAIAWLVKCLETYLIAYEQREFLDEDGTRSQSDTLRKAKERDRAIDYSEKVQAASDARIAELESLLRERDDLLDQYEKNGGTVENSMLDDDVAAILAKGKKMTYGDYDDPVPVKPKRRRPKKGRK